MSGEENGQNPPLDPEARQALENLRMRLLDLTARNRLINFRHTKTGSLRIIDELPNQLVETLLSDSEMRFEAIPEPTERELIEAGYLELDEETGRIERLKPDPTAEVWAKHLGFYTSYEVPEPSMNDGPGNHEDNAIQTLFYPYEMEARLGRLLQTAESAIQEMGANILYLAFGFLEWYENANIDNARLAPLFLVPVRLHKGRLNPITRTYEYTLSYSEEDIIPNLSLREKLRIDFGMALPELDENTQPEAYFEEVRELIDERQPRWCLHRYISLALLNFSKLLMYLDLDPSRWPAQSNIVNHPVVSRFLSGIGQEELPDQESPGDLGFGEEYSIDDLEKVHVNYPLIDDADSSQHSALIDAVDGKNLVIEGPPGTGKSQTITNLIAAAMAQGKKVLFVAEKLAALEVVKNRLDRANLGEFCLELHSHKSQKRKVLDDIQARLATQGNYRKPRDIEVEIQRYEELKAILKHHADKINQPWKKTGMTLHEVFMAATRYRKAININPESLHPKGYDGNNYDAATQRRNEDHVKAYQQIYKAVTQQLGNDAALVKHPWYGVCNSDLQLFDLERVKESLNAWQSSLKALKEQRALLSQVIGCEDLKLAQGVQDLQAVLTDIQIIPVLKGNEILESVPVLRGDLLKKTQRYLDLFEAIQVFYRDLADRVGKDVVNDLSIVDRLLTGDEKLKQLVNRDIALEILAEAINCLATILEQLKEFEEPIHGIPKALGDTAVQAMTVSVAGLKELQTAIEHIASLNPTYWKHRNELFDNEELDELLPQLRKELEELLTLQNKLQDVSRLSQLPKESEIRKISAILAAAGLFRWFQSEWRHARKRLLSYAATPQVKYKTLVGELESMAVFAGKLEKFDQNLGYKQALGPYLQGLKTDVAALEGLRSWYKKIRQQYGIGFGKKVGIGDAILDLSPSMAQSVRSLVDRGMSKQLEGILKDVERLREVFSPVQELQSDNKMLNGDDGIIHWLINKVREVIQACSPLTENDRFTINDVSENIRRMNLLKGNVEKWRLADYDQKLFGGKLNLQVGLGKDNVMGIAALRNTLSLAECVDGRIRNQIITDYILNKPEKERFAILREHGVALAAAVETEKSQFLKYSELVQLASQAWMSVMGDSIEGLLSRNEHALQNGESLQNWLDYVRAKDLLSSLGMENIVSAIEKSDIQIDHVIDAYQAAIMDMLAREILHEDPKLGRFSGHTQGAIQQQFKEYDNRLKALQCEQIAWRIDQNRVPLGSFAARVSGLSDMALLEHECNKKKRHIPIRQLVHRAGRALAALKPCFMMGPMSVSQYLEPGNVSFDLVVMDEASQIKPQDALGAVARGGQLVVVGDPKQLPPTSFFDRAIEEGEEDPTSIEESESILDATLPMFQARRLRWHYRSQHESLIAFSNHSFYDSDLVLFPSPYKETDEFGVQFTRVRRGSFVNRKNLEEAKVISEAVRDHFMQRPEETLGVVAMSAEQRLHIERAIETLAKDDVIFQDRLDTDATKRESLFIKNLENVQGDERDIVYISMTYGPQEPGGNVYQRFGPINADVGWRRLNVLFTRARKRMHIFSSMGSEDIVLGTSSKRGVHALRNFLSYCETGILHKTEIETGKGPDSDFEVAVMQALREEGFECIPQVGVAGFFIDVAVVDPGKPGRFLMGIECDGATYHSAKSARDRDRLRQEILERLGWRIRRIWSTDWFKNPKGELAPIIRELHELKSPIIEEDLKFEDEKHEIDRIVNEADSWKEQSDLFAFDEGELRDKLSRFDAEVVRKDCPDTLETKRLLRPAMLEALLEYTPTNKVEFLELIPSYIRQATDPAEGKYLEQIFDIINASIVE